MWQHERPLAKVTTRTLGTLHTWLTSSAISGKVDGADNSGGQAPLSHPAASAVPVAAAAVPGAEVPEGDGTAAA